MRTFASWQSGSTTLSVWYQTIDSLPASPATAHGHSTRALGGLATATGADHVCPKSFDTAIMMWFGAGLGVVTAGLSVQPPLVFVTRSFVSQIRYRLSALSKVTIGKWPNTVVFVAFTGLIVVSPGFHTLVPIPFALPLSSKNRTGSTSLPLWWS